MADLKTLEVGDSVELEIERGFVGSETVKGDVIGHGEPKTADWNDAEETDKETVVIKDDDGEKHEFVAEERGRIEIVSVE